MKPEDLGTYYQFDTDMEQQLDDGADLPAGL